MAGFSFTGALGLAVLGGQSARQYGLAMYCLVLSFILYFAFDNIQAYKFYRWVDWLGDGFRDSATLALLVAIVAVVFAGGWLGLVRYAFAVVTGLVWLTTHVLRVWLTVTALKESSRAKKGVS